MNSFKGADFGDPKGLLEGAGKKNRHIKIGDPKILDSEELASFIKSIAEIPR